MHRLCAGRFVGVLVLLALPAFSIVGCGSGDDGRQRVPLGSSMEQAAIQLPAELQMRLDSGNAAFRARDYDAALYHFTEAGRIDPDLAAAWYGIGMTHEARGDAEAAEAAMARVHRLAPGIPLQHPSSTGSAHPEAPASADGYAEPGY